MPLFEYECIPCRKNVEDSLKDLEKKVTKKKVSELVKKYDNINHIGVLDLENEKILAEYGKRVSLIAENRYLDVKKDYKTTFKELVDKYEENFKSQVL